MSNQKCEGLAELYDSTKKRKGSPIRLSASLKKEEKTDEIKFNGKNCPECGSMNLIIDKDRKEIICRDCGLVIETKYCIGDLSQEWDKATIEKTRGEPAITWTDFDRGL